MSSDKLIAVGKGGSEILPRVMGFFTNGNINFNDQFIRIQLPILLYPEAVNYSAIPIFNYS